MPKTKKTDSANELLGLRKTEPRRRNALPKAEGPTIGRQVEILLEWASGVLEEVESCDEDIEDRGDDFDFDGENPNATAALEAVLDLPPIPARLAKLPVQCPRLDWDDLRDCVKAIGDQLEAVQEAIGDRKAGEFGEELEGALSWFNEF
ncbi:hypothetical protein [Paludisphaera soli]|uniref:hypothetical protein n=1 Tax=Paludisphaera soli TaxID=2712865 RepID=UPI0013EE3E64|nr:hypothetical protein [Paludisphaera soli]